jgi:hypothetical protein
MSMSAINAAMNAANTIDLDSSEFKYNNITSIKSTNS